MKITVGVENSQHGIELIQFMHALDFPSLSLHLSYVLEIGANAGVYGSHFDSSTSHLAAYFQQLKDEGHAALGEVVSYATEQGYTPAEAKLLVGSASNELLSFAEQANTELLVVGSSGKSTFQRFIWKSTSRKAAIHSRQSVLIVKKPLPLAGKKLTVVCATDHSPYSNRCLEQFFQWQPRGVHRVIILSVYADQSPSSRIHDSLSKENAELIAKLIRPGIHFENRIEAGVVEERIAQVMQESGADLLVLGSQGHGFLERLTIGSVSLDQAMNHPYSVLIMRAEPLAAHASQA